MFEKLNSIVYNEPAGTVVKCVTAPSEAIAEKAALATLADRTSSGEGPLLAPKLYRDECSDYTVCMEYVPGIRVYDLTALLNQIIRLSPDRRLVERAYCLKRDLIAFAVHYVTRFQACEIQTGLKAALGSAVGRYDFVGKLVEAVDYLCARFDVAPSSRLYEEVEYVADYLGGRLAVTFRDATLKNFIVKLPHGDGGGRDYRDIAEPLGDYLRPTNWQWTDSSGIVRIIDALSESGSLERSIYGIDFESVHALTTKQDDFVHIFTLEVAGISYDAAQRFCARSLAVGDEELNVAILFRCLRDGTRRLFYKCERPRIFATRYYHETVEHNLLVALDALERLRQNSCKEDFLGQLHLLLSRSRKECTPWPWLMRVPPIECTGFEERRTP